MSSKTRQPNSSLSHQKLKIAVPQYVRLLRAERHPLALWASLVAFHVRLAIHRVRLLGHLVCHCLHHHLGPHHHLLVPKVWIAPSKVLRIIQHPHFLYVLGVHQAPVRRSRLFRPLQRTGRRKMCLTSTVL